MFLSFHWRIRHDSQLLSKSANRGSQSGSRQGVDPAAAAPLPTQQFGVTLQFIKENNQGDPLPPVMRLCVEFLSQPDGMDFLSSLL